MFSYNLPTQTISITKDQRRMGSFPRKIVLLGATGSIGKSTLEVLRKHPDKFELLGIAADRNKEKLLAIAEEFSVPHVAIYNQKAAVWLKQQCSSKVVIHCGQDGLLTIATLEQADVVVSAVVGTVALKPTLEAINKGKNIALANKEIMVMAGAFMTQAARENQIQLLPTDSEHNAIFQCLQGERLETVEKLILTASGGAFRNFSAEAMEKVSLAQALENPNWDMGPKVTIDSASMANKGLEVIEAHWLFGISVENIEVMIHPQSIIHSMVQFCDGSVIAQLNPPSMKFSIQYALSYPERFTKPVDTLDFSKKLSLDLIPPCYRKYPCLKLAFATLREGGIAPAVYNASNEIAVQAFISGKIRFFEIPRIIDKTLQHTVHRIPQSIEDLIDAEQQARRLACSLL